MKRHGFSRRRRLTEQKQFAHLFDDPKYYRSRSFLAFWKANDQGFSRLGITIKGRTSSVWRVRLKRTIRHWFRTQLPTGPEPVVCCDVNIVVRPLAQMDLAFIDSLKRELQNWNITSS